MLFARRARNVSVVALIAQFVVRVEFFVMAPAIVLAPLSGFALAATIGLSPADSFWIDIALGLYGVVAACWVAALVVELRVRKIAREAALSRATLPPSYPRLFRMWMALAFIIVAGTIALFWVMVWQPRLD